MGWHASVNVYFFKAANFTACWKVLYFTSGSKINQTGPASVHLSVVKASILKCILFYFLTYLEG